MKEGDVYVVPLDDGSSALCRVLYKSSSFKHVALVGCYGMYLSSVSCYDQIKSGLLAPALYTTVQPSKIANWRFVGNCEILPSEREFSRRIVGGEVFIGDQHLRPAESCDAALPVMLTHGERIFIKKLAVLLASKIPIAQPKNPADA